MTWFLKSGMNCCAITANKCHIHQRGSENQSTKPSTLFFRADCNGDFLSSWKSRSVLTMAYFNWRRNVRHGWGRGSFCSTIILRKMQSILSLGNSEKSDITLSIWSWFHALLLQEPLQEVASQNAFLLLLSLSYHHPGIFQIDISSLKPRKKWRERLAEHMNHKEVVSLVTVTTWKISAFALLGPFSNLDYVASKSS